MAISLGPRFEAGVLSDIRRNVRRMLGIQEELVLLPHEFHAAREDLIDEVLNGSVEQGENTSTLPEPEPTA